MRIGLIFIVMGLGTLCLSCDPEGDKIREEIDHIANQEENAPNA